LNIIQIEIGFLFSFCRPLGLSSVLDPLQCQGDDTKLLRSTRESMMKRKSSDLSSKDDCYNILSPSWNIKRQCHSRIKAVKSEEQAVKTIEPTLLGVAQAANLIMGGKNIVFIPTESVYMACTSIYLSKSSPLPTQQVTLQQLSELSICSGTTKKTSENPPPQPIVLLISNPSSSLNYCLSSLWKKRAYALIDNKNGSLKNTREGNATVILFSEVKEVLRRLMKRFCPSPLIIYLKTSVHTQPSTLLNIATTRTEREESNYVAISNPSHPLVNRVIKETSVSHLSVKEEKKIIVGVPSLKHDDGNNLSYITKAAEVSSSKLASSAQETSANIHVLNGEDKQEAFSVPTCQYGKPFCSSLWIDESSRTLHIRGKHSNNDRHQETQKSRSKSNNVIDITEQQVLRAIRHNSTISTNAKKNYRNRVIFSVLFKWKVTDERTM